MNAHADNAVAVLGHYDSAANRDSWPAGGRDEYLQRQLLHAQVLATLAVAAALESIDDGLTELADEQRATAKAVYNAAGP